MVWIESPSSLLYRVVQVIDTSYLQILYLWKEAGSGTYLIGWETDTTILVTLGESILVLAIFMPSSLKEIETALFSP